MIITPHFNREEFDCKDGTPYPKKWLKPRLKPLCEALEIIRKEVGPIHILSGYRTLEHNKKVGGATRSIHLQGSAADIVARKVPVLTLYNKILELIKNRWIPDGGLGIYHSWVHLDLGKPRRWRE